MYFESIGDFLAMGKHGLYVWLSYGVFLAVICWNIWLVVSSRRNSLRRIRQAWKRAAAEAARNSANEEIL